MSRYVLLDTGPLGQIARRRGNPAMIDWTRSLRGGGARLAVPEICDYELRREYLRAQLASSLKALDQLVTLFDYLPTTTDTMRLAARLWAEARQQGLPTAGLKDLDGDVILAAQAQLLSSAGHEVVVATGNIGHLSRIVQAQVWSTIT